MGEFPSGQRGQTVNLLSLTSLVRIQLPPPKKSYHFDTTFFILYGVMAYHHRTKCGGYHQKERFISLFFVSHHALTCIKLRNDEILARKRDILVFGRKIFSHFVSDDIQSYGLICPWKCAIIIKKEGMTVCIHEFT